jgi:hypothetical protein
MINPDVILFATINDHDVLAVNFWGDGSASKPAPGVVDELPATIRYYQRHGYNHYRNLDSSITSVFMVKQGFDVETARKVVNKFLKEQVEKLSA